MRKRLWQRKKGFNKAALKSNPGLLLFTSNTVMIRSVGGGRSADGIFPNIFYQIDKESEMRFNQTIQVALCSFGLALFTGCSAQSDTRTFDDKDSAAASVEAEHAHGHESHGPNGPNGGHLLEVGEGTVSCGSWSSMKQAAHTDSLYSGARCQNCIPDCREGNRFLILRSVTKNMKFPWLLNLWMGKKRESPHGLLLKEKRFPIRSKKESDLNGHFHLDIGENHFHVDLSHGEHDGHDHAEHDHDHDHEKTESKKPEAEKPAPAKEEAKPKTE